MASGPRSKPLAFGGREHGRRKLMERRPWVRRQRGSSKRGRERRKLHNAEVEAGAQPRQSHFCTEMPIQQFRSRVISSGGGLSFWEHNHRIRPKIGKVWAKIATAMMARSPATRWRYVRGHMSAVIVTLMQHNWIPIRLTSWKDPQSRRCGN